MRHGRIRLELAIGCFAFDVRHLSELGGSMPLCVWQIQCRRRGAYMRFERELSWMPTGLEDRIQHKILRDSPLSAFSYAHDAKGIDAGHMGLADTPKYFGPICDLPPERLQQELTSIFQPYMNLPHPEAYTSAAHAASQFLHELKADVRQVNSELGWTAK